MSIDSLSTVWALEIKIRALEIKIRRGSNRLSPVNCLTCFPPIFKNYLVLFFLCMRVFPVFMDVYTTCMPGVHRGQERSSDLELEL